VSLDDLPLREFHPRSQLRGPRTAVPRAKVPAVDAHNHLGKWLTTAWAAPSVPAQLDLLDACNVSAIVNLDGRWGDELERNLDRYDRAHPGRFATFCHLDWSLLLGDRPAERLVASLRGSHAAGAKGVKVWKDLGLHVRDPRGDLVLPDDRRLAPVWEAAGELGMPVTIHTGDPAAFFEPVDERNERLEELLAHPDWSFADRSRFPSFERLRDAFETLVASHPETAFVGAHVAGSAEDLEHVGRMLDAYPNLHVDLAARIAELGRRPRATRALLERHAGRVLFGTDVFPPDPGEYGVHFRFLETQDEHFAYSTDEVPPQGRWAISGLGLGDEALAAIYAGNARRVIPGLA
jgi:predicted TIM-barrel fold metal-dependent hydrolase